MHLRSFSSVKPRALEGHGPTTLYQNIFGAGSEDGVEMKSFTAFWKMTVKPGGTNRPHVHQNQEQIYTVLRGSSTVMVGEEKQTVKAGDVIYLPAGLTHAVLNETERPCVILAVGAKLPS